MTEPAVPRRPRPHEEPPAPAPKRRQARDPSRLTRASAAWAATAAALLLLVLLIVFVLQNSTQAKVRFLGFAGPIPLAMAVLIAAVARPDDQAGPPCRSAWCLPSQGPPSQESRTGSAKTDSSSPTAWCNVA